MNKKLFLGMFATVGMLLATSCQNDELDAVQAGNEATVSFTLGVEGGVQTRAISDGSGANKLVYAVFDKDGNRITTIAKVEKAATFPTTENITLAKGQTYKVAFWAQNSATSAYVLDDDMNLTIDYTSNDGKNNDETRDAFYAVKEFTVTGNTTIEVELKRPFAQINVGVTDDDVKAAENSGIVIKESKAVIKRVAKDMDLLTGTLGEADVEIVYDFAAIPTEKLNVDLDGDGTKETYHYLSMSYILVDKGTSAVEFTFKPKRGNDIVFSEGLNDVPVQRNWRTNIIGQILTGNIHFTIKIDPAYINDYNLPFNEEIAQGVTYDNATNTYGISSAEGLMYANDNLFTTSGNSYKLLADIDMAGKEWASKINQGNPNDQVSLTFDGNGYTISNWSTTAEGLLVSKMNNQNITIKNLNLDNCSVNSSTGHAALLVGQSEINTGATIIIENVNVNNSSLMSENYVGAFIGWINGYDGKVEITDCSVNNTTLNGEGSTGAFIGHDNGLVTNIENATVTGCIIKGEKLEKSGIVVGTIQRETSISVSDISNNKVFDVENSEKVYGRIVGGVLFMNDAATVNGDYISAAIGKGIYTIGLTEGEYTIPDNAKKKTLSFIGVDKDKVKIDCSSNILALDGSESEFKNLTIKTKGGNYQGFSRMQGIYDNCIFENLYFTMFGKHEFNECTFNVSGTEEHCVWTYGADEVTFNDCVFNYVDRCVNVYTEGGLNNCSVTFNTCKFSTDNSESKGAVEINSGAYTEGVKVDFTNCEKPDSGELVFISTYDQTRGEKATVTIDNESVTPEIK